MKDNNYTTFHTQKLEFERSQWLESCQSFTLESTSAFRVLVWGWMFNHTQLYPSDFFLSCRAGNNHLE